MGGRGPTQLVHMKQGGPGSELAPAGFAYVASHDDGTYYYSIARDPLARGEAHRTIDLAGYRYGHPLYAWLAWLVSGGGRPSDVPSALLFVSLICLGIGAAAAAVLAVDLGMSPWWGLAIPLNPGILFSVTADTTESTAVAVMLLAIIAWRRERLLAAGILIVGACFAKEPLLLVPAALLAVEVVRFLRGRRAPALAARATALLAGPFLYGLWAVYLRVRFGAFSSGSGTTILGTPFVGWIDTLRQATTFVEGGDYEIGEAAVPIVLSIGCLLSISAIRALRFRTVVDPVFLAYFGLVSCLDADALLYPKDTLRELAPILALVPFVLGGRLLARPATAAYPTE
jgi:hypothetical protein